MPAWIDQRGIDPSLFWDDDGTCYYCSTGNLDGVRGIFAFAINPFTGTLFSIYAESGIAVFKDRFELKA